jgi:ATP synthase protein I
MTDPDRDDGPVEAPESRFQADVARKAERRRRAQKEGQHNIWFSLGMFGLVGWSVALPTLLGLAAGLWLDHRYPVGRISWTLTMLAVGAVAGCANAWHWVKNESRER